MGNYLFLLVQSGRSASATTCLLLLIPAVSCFFPRLLNMYHFVQNTLSDINADPDGRHQSATVRPRWSLLCWCFFFSFLLLSFMFWLRAFTLKVPKNWFFECYISCRLCGPVALALDSLFCCCAVCKSGAKHHQNTTDTKRTVHRMYMWRGNWAQMWSDCQEVPLSFFFFGKFLNLTRKSSNTRKPKTRTPDNLSLISRRRSRLFFVAEAFCQRRCVHTVAMCRK